MALNNARVGESSNTKVVVEHKEETSVAGLPNNRSTRGYCQNCGSCLGDFYNSWYKITGSYYVPALLGSYRSLLRNTGKRKAASRGTNLEGCTIQPVSCPALCTDTPIGFVVVDAPPDKKQFRGRDFFKLSRIELRCEQSSSKSFVVKPLEETAKDLSELEDSDSPSLTPQSTRIAPSMGYVTMELLPTSSGQGHQYTHQEPHHDLTHQSPAGSHPPPAAQVPMSRSISTSRTESQPIATSTLKTQAIPESQFHTKVHSSTPASTPANAVTDLAQTYSSSASHNPRTHHPLRSPSDLSLNVIQRLQTQISQNSGALAAQTRDIRRGEESCALLEETLRRELSTQSAYQSGELQRVDGAVARLHHEMLAMRQTIENLRHELHTTRGEEQSQKRSVAPPAQTFGANDTALELMAQQIAITSQKANEIDMLKITIEIMKSKIYRLEEGIQQPPEVGPIASSIVVPHGQPPAQRSPQLQAYHSSSIPISSKPPEQTQTRNHVSNQTTGWATVNAGVKRNHGADESNLYNGHAQGASSTKRPKLASDPPSQTLSSSAPQYHSNAQAPQSQFLPYARPLPSQPSLSASTMVTQSQPSLGASIMASQPQPSSGASIMASQPQPSSGASIMATQSQPSSQVPPATPNAHPDDNWRVSSQRDIEHRPRGRGRGGGPGSRGGKSRKSMPAQFQAPEWDREDWQNIPDYQNRPDMYINQAVRPTTGIARRGTGGGGGGTRREYTPTDRSIIMNVTPGVRYESPGEFYDSGKKTRTKPIRNADGVLIRKDGRPDMRSQSSAANLRKVHSRKEGEDEFSPSETPTHLHDGTAANATATPSPSGRGTQEATTGTHSKHNAIMDKMFPRGMEESRKENDYTRELFDHDHDHTIHSHAQPSHSIAKPPPSQVKQEQGEQDALADIQSPGAGDVNGETNGGSSGMNGAATEGSVANGRRAGESPVVQSSEPAARVVPRAQAMDLS